MDADDRGGDGRDRDAGRERGPGGLRQREALSSSAASGTGEQQRQRGRLGQHRVPQQLRHPRGQLYAKGVVLTVATDKPVYPPRGVRVNNKPRNQTARSYELARCRYAVAAQLGFPQVPGHLGVRAVQQLIRAGAEEVRLRHQRDLRQARQRAPGGHVLGQLLRRASRR